MKNKKIRIILFLLLLCFIFLLQQSEMFFYEKDNKNDNINLKNLPSTSTTYIYEYKTWGGSDYDRGYGIALDNLGNIFITGDTSSFGAGYYNVFLLKYDSVGNLLWNTTWGGAPVMIMEMELLWITWEMYLSQVIPIIL